MNYFELYDLQVSFNIDGNLLKKKFYELSKRYHPDFYVNESEEKQEEILQLSTQTNKGYQTLSDKQKLVAYILSMSKLLDDSDKYQLPQDFLMEMMEVNEALMELNTKPNTEILEQISSQIRDMEDNLSKELDYHTQNFDAQNGNDNEIILLKIKDIWYRKKYLLRIQDSLNKFATR